MNTVSEHYKCTKQILKFKIDDGLFLHPYIAESFCVTYM